jgi:DNA (cytosine-5)-methyltransferase 1
MPISIIDLFAGPGGLNEGFSQIRDHRGNRAFKTIASIECETTAHLTLQIRALYRRLADAGELKRYNSYLRKEISRQQLLDSFPEFALAAQKETICATLGKSEVVNLQIEDTIANALRESGSSDCVLIGGPPCQAYSVAGRARRRNEERVEFEKDQKHLLYQEYLRIVNRFQPAIFLMENVPGLLTARHSGSKMFERICDDLRQAGYDLHPISPQNGLATSLDDPTAFVVNADEFGVPQARARVFILGTRSNLNLKPLTLDKALGDAVTVRDVLKDIPKIRSRLTREVDTGVNWQTAIKEIGKYRFAHIDPGFRDSLLEKLEGINPHYSVGDRPMQRVNGGPDKLLSWFVDPECDVIVNHNSRGHMRKDLMRYFYWAHYAAYFGVSPKLNKVPHYLRPAHQNIGAGVRDIPFDDRFRVQVRDMPATTVVSHIAKDGHYYIHYDAKQCRSLSVREAARLQTFPDNYFFEGSPTDQYRQVGNAVPPYLAMQIAGMVMTVMCGGTAGKVKATGT